MDILCLISIGALFGAAAMYSAMKIIDHYKRQEAETAEIKKQNDAILNDLSNLHQQIKGRQLPYFIRDGLEDIKTLENNDSFDLARIRTYAEELIKTVDQAADRQTRMVEIYNRLRNHKKVN